MRLIIIFFVPIFLFSCNENIKSQDELFMKIDYDNFDRESTLNLQIINNSNKSYFICMDSLRIYENTEFNARLNRLIHPRIVFYSRGDSIGSGPTSSFPNYISSENDKSHFNCVMQIAKKRPLFIKQLKTLKKILILKSKDTIRIKVPFKNTYEICNRDYTFLRKKGDYEMELKYKMDKTFINEIVEKKLILELEQKDIFPYFKEINSNKVPFIIK